MHSIYVKDIVRLCAGEVICGDKELVLHNFCLDTRKICSGDVYVGICGEKLDGNDFYQEAIDKGASCLILSKLPKEEVVGPTVVLVEDTLKCLQELAGYKRSLYDIPVIAVTGSVGKTSTKDIISSVVSKKYQTHKTSGNYNNHLGVPLTILSMKENDQALVVEMGMNHLGEISVLSQIAKPTISVITNIGTAHIGILGSRENIRQAKLEILDGMMGKQLILNHDDDMLVQVEEELSKRYDLKTVSIGGNGVYQAVHLVEDTFSSRFDIQDEISNVEVNVGGKAYVYNSLVAYAVGKCLGIEEKLIKEGISEFKLSSHRLEKKVMKRGTVLIDDTYNANYDSMKSSLELLGKVKGKRRIAILGDMLELGDYTEEFHRKLGDVLIENHIDVLVTIGEYSQLIGKRAIELGMSQDNIYSFEHESDSYLFLEEYLNDQDIVLLKGSHGIHLVGIVEKLMEI